MRSTTSTSESLRSGGIFDFDAKAERLEEVTRELEHPDVWNNPQRAQDLGKERASLDRVVGGIRSLTERLGDAGDLLGLAVE
jgi:peptide chain release factor 2